MKKKKVKSITRQQYDQLSELCKKLKVYAIESELFYLKKENIYNTLLKKKTITNKEAHEIREYYIRVGQAIGYTTSYHDLASLSAKLFPVKIVILNKK